MEKKWWIAIGLGTAVVGTGVGIGLYRSAKKKKEAKLLDETSQAKAVKGGAPGEEEEEEDAGLDSGGQTTSAPKSRPTIQIPPGAIPVPISPGAGDHLQSGGYAVAPGGAQRPPGAPEPYIVDEWTAAPRRSLQHAGMKQHLKKLETARQDTLNELTANWEGLSNLVIWYRKKGLVFIIDPFMEGENRFPMYNAGIHPLDPPPPLFHESSRFVNSKVDSFATRAGDKEVLGYGVALRLHPEMFGFLTDVGGTSSMAAFGKAMSLGDKMRTWVDPYGDWWYWSEDDGRFRVIRDIGGRMMIAPQTGVHITDNDSKVKQMEQIQLETFPTGIARSPRPGWSSARVLRAIAGVWLKDEWGRASSAASAFFPNAPKPSFYPRMREIFPVVESKLTPHQWGRTEAQKKTPADKLQPGQAWGSGGPLPGTPTGWGGIP